MFHLQPGGDGRDRGSFVNKTNWLAHVQQATSIIVDVVQTVTVSQIWTTEIDATKGGARD